MELKIDISERMGESAEHDMIRMSHDLLKSSGISVGSVLNVKCNDGSSLLLRVGESSEGSIVVSRKVYRLIKTGPYKTTLGCDPEFLFIDPIDRICRADTFLPKVGKVGSDGPLGELRPDPEEHEDGVVENLRVLIKSLPESIFKRFGHATILSPEGHSEKSNLSLGFHIHLGAPVELTSYAAPNTEEFIDSFITAMDYFVGIPGLIPEDTSLRRLNGENYGMPGDWRMSKSTIEYRTPGGFHLRHPDYARGLMGLAMCTGESILSWAEDKSQAWSGLDKISSFDTIAKEFGIPDKDSIRGAFYERRKEKALLLLPNIIKGLEKMSHYSKHEASIKHFLKMLLSNQKVKPQLLHNW